MTTVTKSQSRKVAKSQSQNGKSGPGMFGRGLAVTGKLDPKWKAEYQRSFRERLDWLWKGWQAGEIDLNEDQADLVDRAHESDELQPDQAQELIGLLETHAATIDNLDLPGLDDFPPRAPDGEERESVRRGEREPAGASPRLPASAEQAVFQKTGLLTIALQDLQTLDANPAPDPAEVERIAESFRQRGQDEPIIVLPAKRLPREIELQPDKRYLVLAGATRLAAARRLMWGTIQARERTDRPTHADVLAFAFRNNVDRRTVGTAEKAGYAAALAACEPAGKPKAQIEQAVAERMGLDRPEINQLLRFDELPKAWRDRVLRFERDPSDEDGLAWTYAKALLPYAHLAAVMAAVESIWQDSWERTEFRDKEGIRQIVQQAARAGTRPVDRGEKHDYGYQQGGRLACSFELTPKVKEELAIEKLPLGPNGKWVEVATAVERYDELQALAIAAAKAKHGGRSSGEPAGASPRSKPKLTAAEERKKHADQDKELADRIARPAGWREQALRLALAEALKPGDWPTEGLYEDLIATTRESEASMYFDLKAWRYEAQRILRARRLPAGHSPPRAHLPWGRQCEGYARYSFDSLDPDGDPLDDLQQLRVITASLILWPVQQGSCDSDRLAKPGELPDRLPAIVASVLTDWSTVIGGSPQTTWEAATKPGPARTWLAAFLKAHNRRQLAALAESIDAGHEIAGAKTHGEEIERLLRAHSGSFRYPSPECLRLDKPKPKKAKSK